MIALGLGLIILIGLLKTQHWRYQMTFCPEYLDEWTPSEFPRNKKNAQRYETMTELGYRHMSTSSIIVAIMVRDMGDRMDSVRERVYRLVRHFKDYLIMVVENNSVDNTRAQLQAWHAKDANVRVIGCDVADDVCEIPIASVKTVGHSVYYRRIAKMVYLRNLYLTEIKQLSMHYDYVAMWDVDVIGSLFTDGVANSLGWMASDPSIDMISAYGAYRKLGLWVYYDTYAHQNLGEHFDIKYKMRHDFEKALFTQHAVGDDLVRIESGFGGFTLYRTEVLLPNHVVYDMSEDDNLECEHTRLHRHLKRKYMNPSMINLILYNP